MAKPPRRKVSTPNTETAGETYVDDNEVDVDTAEDSTDEDYSEDTEDDTDTVEDTTDEETEAGVSFSYPTVDDMEDIEDEETETSAGDSFADVRFVGSTSKKDTPDALVKVCISCHKQFVVGGERYDMYPGKTYLVPKNVKDVLKENDLLRPL